MWSLTKIFIFLLASGKGIRNPETNIFLLLESRIQRVESGIHFSYIIRNLFSEYHETEKITWYLGTVVYGSRPIQMIGCHRRCQAGL